VEGANPLSVEQRNHARYKVAWRSKVAVPGKGMVRGAIKSVSFGGGFLELPFSVPARTVLLMEVYPIVNGQLHTVRMRTQVVYTSLLAGNRGHGIGLKILEVAKMDEKILKMAVQEIASM